MNLGHIQLTQMLRPIYAPISVGYSIHKVRLGRAHDVSKHPLLSMKVSI